MRALFLVSFLSLAAACSGEPAPPPEMTAAERGEIQAEVIAWADQYLEAASNLDAHGVAALFDMADGHFMAGASYRPSWQAFLEGTMELYTRWTVWEPEWLNQRIDVLSPETALFVGEAGGSLQVADGSEFDQRVGFSFVLRKKDGSWTGLFGQAASTTTPRE